MKNTKKVLGIKNIEKTYQKLINNETHNLYQLLFKIAIQKTLLEINAFLDEISAPQISSDQLTKWNNEIIKLE